MSENYFDNKHVILVILNFEESFCGVITDYLKKLVEIINTSYSVNVCFIVCDNVFSQIFYNCSNVEEIFSWHN